jgi:hypothetical protein
MSAQKSAFDSQVRRISMQIQGYYCQFCDKSTYEYWICMLPHLCFATGEFKEWNQSKREFKWQYHLHVTEQGISKHIWNGKT